MISNQNGDENSNPNHTELGEGQVARAYKVEDDDNLTEKDLKRSFLFGNSNDADPDQPGYEGQGTGGDNFGRTNVTTSGDDRANPSQNAGYSNDYFKRTEPSEEHPENNNFTPAGQQGAPHTDGSGAQFNSQKMQEGTSDYDGGTQQRQPANANPEQSKAGDGNKSEPGVADYKPEYDQNKPDYGSNSPDDNDEYPNNP